jgi:hypothetical protein
MSVSEMQGHIDGRIPDVATLIQAKRYSLFRSAK